MSEKRKYDSTVARMAGNIASGMLLGRAASLTDESSALTAAQAVQLARLIIAETARTEPEVPS